MSVAAPRRTSTVGERTGYSGMSINYPRTVAEVLDSKKQYKPAVLRAVRAFARSKPWRGTVPERQGKFRSLHAALAAAYGVPAPILVFETDDAVGSGASSYSPATDTIAVCGRLSVVTFLHEWGHRLFGRSERKAVSWSINLFRRCFPKSFAHCGHDGHMLRARRVEP